MEKKLLSARKRINRIKKQFKNETLEWTIQMSLNSTEPDRVVYACQIHVPAQGVEPLTWVCDSWEELEEGLKKAEKEMSVELVEGAWHLSEIQRCERLIKYHKEKIEELKNES